MKILYKPVSSKIKIHSRNGFWWCIHAKFAGVIRGVMPIRLLLLLFMMSVNVAANGQFYNGLQMSFGKNRLQFNNFHWTYLRYDRFDVYYYQEGEEIARYVARVADKKLGDAEELFYSPLDSRLIFIVYSRLSDFRQSNIGLVGFSDEYNIGGTTTIIDNKVSIYFDGNLDNLEKQVSEVVAAVVI